MEATALSRASNRVGTKQGGGGGLWALWGWAAGTLLAGSRLGTPGSPPGDCMTLLPRLLAGLCWVPPKTGVCGGGSVGPESPAQRPALSAKAPEA